MRTFSQIYLNIQLTFTTLRLLCVRKEGKENTHIKKGGMCLMTQTQVGYWQNVETKRHNVASEFQAANELTERNRSNLVNEGLSASTINENVRHNKATEGVEKSKVKETRRHNKTTEKETTRHNVKSEKETTRHNVKSEDLTKRSLDITEVLNQAIAAEKNANANLSDQKAKVAAKDAKYYALNKIASSKGTAGTIGGVLIALDELSKTSGAKELKETLSKDYGIKYDEKTKIARGTGKDNKGKYYTLQVGRKTDGTTYPYISITNSNPFDKKTQKSNGSKSTTKSTKGKNK